MHLPMKGKRYADVEAIQKACTGDHTGQRAKTLV